MEVVPILGCTLVYDLITYQADSGAKQHFGRPDDRKEEEVFRREPAVEFGHKFWVAGFFTEARSFTFEDYRSVGFTHQDQGHDHKGAGLEGINACFSSGKEELRTRMAISQKFQRQPSASIRNPPIMGPTQGP